MISFSQLRNMIFILISAIALGTVLMIGVYCLPTDRMMQNIKNSTEHFEVGEFPQWSNGMIHTTIDNFTDAIMLFKAIYPVENAVEDAMLLPSWNPMWDGYYFTAKGIVQIIKDGHLDVETEENVYPRYWHGYLTILKPCLLVLKYEQLRVLNLYIQFFLAMMSLILLYKKLGIYYTYAFAIVIMIINPITTVLSFQHTNVYCTMLLTVISILLFNERLKQGNRYIYFFMIMGIITAYFDLLTYPVVPLGIGLIIYFALNKNFLSQASIKSLICNLLSKCFSWSFGYIGMWSGKIAVATILTNYNAFQDALNELMIRISHHDGHTSYGQSITITDTIASNLHSFGAGAIKIVFIITFLYFLYIIITRKKKFLFDKFTFSALLFTFSLPFLWYAFVCNHSFMHVYLAYRELTIALFSLLAFVIESIPELKHID